jgi:hypothetical protein
MTKLLHIFLVGKFDILEDSYRASSASTAANKPGFLLFLTSEHIAENVALPASTTIFTISAEIQC